MLLADRVRFTALSFTPANAGSGVWCQSWLPDGTESAFANSDWTVSIWVVAEPAGELGRVTAVDFRASVRHTNGTSFKSQSKH